MKPGYRDGGGPVFFQNLPKIPDISPKMAFWNNRTTTRNITVFP